MSNANVRPISAAVNPTISDVVTWLKQKGERGELGKASAKLRITSINSLSTVLGEDEPRDAKWLLDNIHDVALRWATLNQANTASTVRTYESRARSGLEDYFEWKADPTAFRFKRRPVGDAPEKSATKAKAKKPQSPSTQQQQAAPPPLPQEPPRASHGQARNFPLGSGRTFEFTLPSEDGLTVAEVRKIACHLFTLASDFDLSTPSHAQVFSVVLAKD